MKRRLQVFVLGLLLLSGVVIAQENYTLRFYQPSPTLDDLYQVQILGATGWEFLDMTTFFVDPCPECEKIALVVPQHGAIRLRRLVADSGGVLQPSAWTDPILTPEPGMVVMLGAGVLGLVMLGRRR